MSYYIVWDASANEAEVICVRGDWWTPDNPSGVRLSELAGLLIWCDEHGKPFATRSDALRVARELTDG